MDATKTFRADKRIAFATDGFSVVVVRHPGTGRWLAVSETRNRGWWLPAGHVDRGQSFVEAAHAETLEEAGLRVVLKGILAIEHTLMSSESARMRVVFYAEPEDPTAPPKTIPDNESLGAAWMSVDDLRAKQQLPPPQGLRGAELLRWAMHVEAGGHISPIELLQREDEGPSAALQRVANAALPMPTAPGDALSEGGLRRAFASGDTESVRLALLGGADVNAPLNAKQWRPLHMAAEQSNVEMVRLLMLAGAEANSRTHKGRTPLHFASSRGATEVIRCLLLAGADPAAIDDGGTSCLDACDPQKIDAVRELLEWARKG